MVCKHNLHKCAITVNGCKKDISDRCRHGYSHTETINETYVDELTDRVVYQRWHCDDLRVVPYNLQLMMEIGIHTSILNTVALDIVCNIYINISSKGQHEKKELKCIQSKSLILMMRLNYSFWTGCMCNGGNVAFLWVSGLSSIYSSCLFFQSVNSRAIGFYC
jgi:hypothetical protein